MPGRRGSREARGEIVVAVMVLSLTIGAAVVAGFGQERLRGGAIPAGGAAPALAGTPGRSAEELIGVLEERAERIAAALEADAARAARKPPRDRLASSFPSSREEPEARVPTPGARDAFLALHRRHVDALRRGHHFAAHEIHREIQHLLADEGGKPRRAPKAAVAGRTKAARSPIYLYVTLDAASLVEPEVELSFLAPVPAADPPVLRCASPRRAWETPGCGDSGRDRRGDFPF